MTAAEHVCTHSRSKRLAASSSARSAMSLGTDETLVEDPDSLAASSSVLTAREAVKLQMILGEYVIP